MTDVWVSSRIEEDSSHREEELLSVHTTRESARSICERVAKLKLKWTDFSVPEDDFELWQSETRNIGSQLRPVMEYYQAVKTRVQS